MYNYQIKKNIIAVVLAILCISNYLSSSCARNTNQKIPSCLFVKLVYSGSPIRFPYPMPYYEDFQSWQHTYSTTFFHASQVLFCLFHVSINLIHTFFNPVQLFYECNKQIMHKTNTHRHAAAAAVPTIFGTAGCGAPPSGDIAAFDFVGAGMVGFFISQISADPLRHHRCCAAEYDI
ncbi:hypothetical protein AGLY_002278 [Aphis glycines]|uniref:Uncharacterized protein n=1 Tax=Aphis glycines TaxID=307491 RepID=A0A6G0U2Y4_APHGL|nr:hypothetical protein AGLY_002278 [Aphis glycines]